jgi:hypothetical protein
MVASAAHAQCSNVVTDADVARVKAQMIADIKQKYGYDIQPSDADARQEAQYRVTQAYIACLTNSAIKQEDDTVRRAEQENAANAAAASALSDTANSLNNAATQTYMPPPSAFSMPEASMPPPAAVPIPDPCSMMSCPQAQQSPPQYVPYDAVKDFMPGMNPNGTAK